MQKIYLGLASTTVGIYYVEMSNVQAFGGKSYQG